MPHKCEACLIACEDFRLHQRKDGRNYFVDFIKGLGVDCDTITRGGGVQDLVRPPRNGYSESLLRDIMVSVNLHNIKTVYLLNHEDCGAYSGMNFSSREEELKQHSNDLKAAKEVILREFPDVEIKLYFAELEPGTEDVFVIKKIT